MSKITLAIIVSVALICIMVSILEPTMEETDATVIGGGSCGTNLEWSFSDDGTLTISGEGRMNTYGSNDAPWSGYIDQIMNVHIGENVRSISAYAFRNAPITSLVIPDSVTYIGENAFAGCNRMTTLYIGSGITEWEDHVFSNCTSLTKIEYNVVSATNEFSRYVTNVPFAGCGSDTASGVTVIFGPSVNAITSDLFSGCSDVRNVILGENVRTIGDRAFRGTGITEIEFPSRVTTIGDSAFSGSSLRSINVPDNVTTIYENAFSGCTSARSINIGNGITFWDDSVFENCNSVSSIYIDAISPSNEFSRYVTNVPFAGCGSSTSSGVSVTFGPSVRTITSELFEGCSDVNEVTLGTNVQTIGADAFQGTGITTILFPSSVTTIGDYAFSNSSLRTIDIPDNVTTVGDYAFSECSSVKTISIGRGITAWYNGVFENCSSVTLINYNAVSPSNEFSRYVIHSPFAGCGNTLDDMIITIGNATVSITSNLFRDTYANTVNIGPNVESIGNNAFLNNPYMKVVNFTSLSSNPPSLGSQSFAMGASNMPAEVAVYSRFDGRFLDNVSGSYTILSYDTYHGEMYTVTFVTNCGQSVPEQQVESGFTASKPTVENKGYWLNGWFTDSSLTRPFDFSTPITSDLTIYASWSPLMMVTISFKTNGGDNMGPVQILQGETFSGLPSPNRDGYEFTGWYYDAELTRAVNANDIVSEDVTLYASWNILPAIPIQFDFVVMIVLIIVFIAFGVVMYAKR